MAKVYGTNETDFLGVFRGLFDRDGVTDGDDWIFGFGGDDWIEGHDGNDFLFGGEGADLLDGGDDIDTAIYSDSPYGVTVDLQTGKGHGGTAEGDLLYSIENLVGSWWGDHLTGTPMTTYCPDSVGTTTSKAAPVPTHSMAVGVLIGRSTPTPLPA